MMKRKDFVTLVMSVIGGILLAIGMCMTLLPEWNAFNQGVMVGVVGFVVLLAMVIVRRRMEGKPAIVITPKVLGTVALGVVGALFLGLGLCMTMVWEGLMIQGIVVGCIGIAALVALVPVIRGIE